MPRLRAQPSETQIQAAILQYLNFSSLVAWAARMNSGGATFGEKFVRFGFKGCPDILGQLTDGRLLAIEVKRPRNYPTQLQHEFLELASGSGAAAAYATSVAEAEKIVLGKLTYADQRADVLKRLNKPLYGGVK